jgi:hypothetical protein
VPPDDHFSSKWVSRGFSHAPVTNIREDPVLIPIKLGDAAQDRMHLLGGGEMQLVVGKTITVRARESGAQVSVVVEGVDRYGDGRLRLVRASVA